MIDFSQINNAALAQCPGVLEKLLPGGRLNGHEYVCSNINGGVGESFSVNVQNGLWKDFSDDNKGGRDIVSLLAEQHGLKKGEAARELGRLVGVCAESGTASSPNGSRTAERVCEVIGVAMVHAGLTILRGHQCAGKPATPTLKPMNGFNEWSGIVRGALVWLGMPDPLDTQKNLEACDPERELLGTVLTAWWSCLGDQAVVASDLLRSDENRVPLYQALSAAVNARSGLNSKSLGKWLSRYQGRIVDGFNIVNKGSWQKSKMWAVHKAA